MRNAVGVLSLAVLAALPVGGCATKLRDYACVTAPDAVAVDVNAIWACNRKIIVRSIKGKRFSLREFRQAAAFFERLTGIPADVDPSEQGILPGGRLDRSLDAWDRWRSDHPDALAWDAGSGRVVHRREAH